MEMTNFQRKYCNTRYESELKCLSLTHQIVHLESVLIIIHINYSTCFIVVVKTATTKNQYCTRESVHFQVPHIVFKLKQSNHQEGRCCFWFFFFCLRDRFNDTYYRLCFQMTSQPTSDFGLNDNILAGGNGNLEVLLKTTQMPFQLSPERTIVGLSVDTFSYIFLSIGIAAPVIFLVVVIISMKCYTNRRFKRYKQYEARMRITQNIWDLERKHYFRDWKGGPGNIGSNRDYPDGESYFVEDFGGRHLAVPSFMTHKSRIPTHHVDSVTYSNSNPDVFFKETQPALLLDNNINSTALYGVRNMLNTRHTYGHVRAVSSPSEINMFEYLSSDSEQKTMPKANNNRPSLIASPTILSDNTNQEDTIQNASKSADPSQVKIRPFYGTVPRSNSRNSVNSEEARVLESFDQIYKDLDIDSSTLNTNSGRGDGESDYEHASISQMKGENNNRKVETVNNARDTGIQDKKRSHNTVNGKTHSITVDLHKVPTQEKTYSLNSRKINPNNSGFRKNFNNNVIQNAKQRLKHHSSTNQTEISIGSVMRPVHLPLISGGVQIYSSALVSSIATPIMDGGNVITGVNPGSTPSPIIGSNGFSYTSPSAEKLLNVGHDYSDNHAFPMSFSNTAFSRSQDTTPTDVITKL